jgi:hypothetical protein
MFVCLAQVDNTRSYYVNYRTPEGAIERHTLPTLPRARKLFLFLCLQIAQD